MALKAGIVGLPNVGKSTLFNAITKKNILAANYPFATIDPNVGTVTVPDERLQKLEDMYIPERTIPTSFEFTDIAGLVKGASLGEGLGNKFLSHIREVDAICHVVRCFDDENIIHVENGIDPIRDIEIINLELSISDLEIINGRISRIAKKAQTNRDKDALKELETLVTEYAKKEGAQTVKICAKLESELSELTDDDKKEMLSVVGIEESGLDKLIKITYDILGLATYFTVGSDEVRAWTFKKGMNAKECAGIIHTDFEKGFIKAEVISYEDLIQCGSELKVREAGRARLEGKDYIMQDGDICHFRFNV